MKNRNALFTKIKIGNFTVPNRIAMAPMGTEDIQPVLSVILKSVPKVERE